MSSQKQPFNWGPVAGGAVAVFFCGLCLWGVISEPVGEWLKEEEAKASARASERARAADAERQAKEVADREAELRKFATEVVPGFQQAIDKLAEEIERAKRQRAEFEATMQKQGIDVSKSDGYRKKGQLIEQMKQDRQNLLATRESTYIRWKEFQLLGNSAQAQRELDDLRAKAMDAAKAATKHIDDETK